MRQRITLKVEMNASDKSRSKAMKIAVDSPGVRSVAIQGPANDQLVVVGENIDTADLTRALRKKVGHASIVSVHVVPNRNHEMEDPMMTMRWPNQMSYYDMVPQLQQPGSNNYYYVRDYDYDQYGGSCSLM